MRRAARVDANQPEIVSQLRDVPGVTVFPTHQLGSGFPDICVGYQDVNYFFEIKDGNKPPSKRRLTADEEKFHERWKGQVDTVLTVEDCLEVMGILVI
jgi:hypothetical protein